MKFTLCCSVIHSELFDIDLVYVTLGVILQGLLVRGPFLPCRTTPERALEGHLAPRDGIVCLQTDVGAGSLNIHDASFRWSAAGPHLT